MKKNKKKYCMGGNIPKYKVGGDIGDLFRNYGLSLADTTLTTLGASNVIKDSDYTGKGSNFAKGYANTVGSIGNKALPIISNMVAPGSGSLVSMGQQTISQFNPQDNSQYNSQYPIYSNGGNTNIPNAELEKQENAITPDNQFLQFNGNSHENGGIPVNLPENTIIFSDKLKASTGKTFAKENMKNNTNKEDKILSNPKSSALARKTAELMKSVKTKNSQDLFNEQETLKQSKIDRYTKRLGGVLSNNTEQFIYPNNTPSSDLSQLKTEYPDYAEFKKGGWIQGAVNPAHKGYCTPMTKSTCTGHRRALALTFKKHHGFHKKENGGLIKYDNGGTNYLTPGPIMSQVPIDLSTSSNYTTPDLNLPNSINVKSPINYNALDFQQYTQNPNYDPYRTGNYSNSDLSPISNNNPSNSLKTSNKSIRPIVKNTAYGLANNAGYLYDLYRSNKPEQETVNPMKANYLDPTESLRQADIESRNSANDLANISDRSSYMGARIANSTANTLNKANILSNFGNQNSQIANDFTKANNEIDWRTRLYNAQNRGQTRNIKSNAIGNIGMNIASQMNDNKAEQLDKDKLSMLPEIYNSVKNDPDYIKLLEKYGYKK